MIIIRYTALELNLWHSIPPCYSKFELGSTRRYRIRPKYVRLTALELNLQGIFTALILKETALELNKWD